MKKFSWHSEPGLAPHWYKIYGWLPNRYLPIVMFGDSIPIYKPNRKGKPKAKRNKLFNDSMRSIYGRKWPDVKKILKNTTKIEIKDIRGIKDSQHLVELFLSPTPIMEFAPGDLQL